MFVRISACQRTANSEFGISLGLEHNMNEQQRAFHQHWPNPIARLNAEQTAWALNFQAHDIPVLVRAGLLKPLGNPRQSAVKYYSALVVQQHAMDPAWLSKATNAVYRHWQNRNKDSESPEKES